MCDTMSVRLGYACISLPMREKNIYTGRTLTLKTLAEKGQGEVRRLALANVADLLTIIEFNETRGIRFFRIGSHIIPHSDSEQARMLDFDIEFLREGLSAAGKRARELGHRLTFHVDHFAQFGSPREDVVVRTFRDVTTHARIFEMMGMRPELGSVMILHGGGVYDDKAATLVRWAAAFRRLPENVGRFVALENDEWHYSVMDLLPMCEDLGIPLCVDFFHHQVMYPDKKAVGYFDVYDPALVRRIMATWKRRGIKPKCHWSNQAPDARKGAHGDCVQNIPAAILAICREYDVDVMVECKNKDLCVMKMYRKHFDRVVNNGRVEWYLKK